MCAEMRVAGGSLSGGKSEWICVLIILGGEGKESVSYKKEIIAFHLVLQFFHKVCKEGK